MRKPLLIAAGLLLVSTAVLADMYQDASNAKLPEAVSNLGNGAPLAASVTCTTANGSATVAGCNSTAGLAIGMVVTGPGIAAGTTVASGITPTGFTMSAVAGAGAGTGKVTVRLDSFWSDVDGGNPSIVRVPGRLMVGGAVGVLNSRYGTPYLTICSTGPDCAAWGYRDSDLGVVATRGAIAISGMSRSSDSAYIPDAAKPAAIGVAGFVINDHPTRTVWAGYFDVQHEASANGRYSAGLEIALKNKGANYTSTAYQSQPGVHGIRMGAGGDDTYGGASVNPVNTGIEFIANSGPGKTFNKGIVFNQSSLTGTTGFGGFGTAIEMAKGHIIKWKTPQIPDSNGFMIYSNVDNPGKDITLVASDDELNVFGGGATPRMFRMINTPNAVNRFEVNNAATGVGPLLAVSGTDPDIPMNVSSKGAGNLLLKNSNGNLAVFNGNGATPYHFSFTAGTTGVPAVITTPNPAIQIVGHNYVTSTKTTNYSIAPQESGARFDNVGATGTVIFTLPAAARNLNFCFAVDAAQTLRVQTAGSDKIAVAATNSAAAGYIQSALPYASVCIQSNKAGQWITNSTPDKTQWTVV